MKKTLILFFLISFIEIATAQNIKVYDKFSEFEPLLHISNDTTYIINFWATWCLPCVKEMPAFQKIHDEYAGKKVKVLLVSIDMSEKVNLAVIPFIERKNLTPEVVVLDDPRQNSWIDLVNSDWNGSIPATLIYNSLKREFYEQTFKFEELQAIVESFD